MVITVRMFMGKEDTVTVGSKSWRLPPDLQRAPGLFPLPWSLLLLMLILTLLSKVFQSLISVIELLSFFLSPSLPLSHSLALGPCRLSLQVQANPPASAFGVTRVTELYYHTCFSPIRSQEVSGFWMNRHAYFLCQGVLGRIHETISWSSST